MENILYCGDNIDILQKYIPEESVDLIYIDPPFKSGKNYNIIFQPSAGKIKGATAQIRAFKDTWRWGIEAEKNYDGLIKGNITKEKPSQKLIELMKSMRSYLDESSMMAYLSMMAPRLLEMKRVLKDTGSIYLHCDYRVNSYLRLILDDIFGKENFRREVIWWKGNISGFRASTNNFVHTHDNILYYTKNSNSFTFNKAYEPYTNEYIKQRFKYDDDNGKGLYRKQGKNQKQYLSESKGVPIPSVVQVPVINVMAKEKLGYPTQKPEALLERIIKASSNEGDLVLDAFCGCGTTMAVAHRLNRKWIGIDISPTAIKLAEKRLKKIGIIKDN